MANDIKDLLDAKTQTYEKLLSLLEKKTLTKNNMINNGNLHFVEKTMVPTLGMSKRHSTLNRINVYRQGMTLDQAMKDSFHRMGKYAK